MKYRTGQRFTIKDHVNFNGNYFFFNKFNGGEVVTIVNKEKCLFTKERVVEMESNKHSDSFVMFTKDIALFMSPFNRGND